MQQTIQSMLDALTCVLQGKDRQLKLSLSCLLAGGHLLIEDLPGMGKTTLATALAKTLGLDYSRVQFTSDMLPADIIGATIFEKDSASFQFHPGPIFSQLLLADEINRTTPKTQSALLEAMAEKQVTVEGQTHKLPQPFFVIATQNPLAQFGTFPLPESQLDRFLLRIELGYPDAEAERALLKGQTGREQLAGLTQLITLDDLTALQQQVKDVKASDALLDYVQRLISYTRQHDSLHYGISPRGGLALLSAAKAWAFIHQREYIIPEDVQAVLPCVFVHRLIHAADSPSEAAAVVEQMCKTVPV
ncbi:MAG: MoxR family ATPase [Pseudomonadales bacterium]|nr:MoxR family ATPase [Pseudomonadales bacterium]